MTFLIWLLGVMFGMIIAFIINSYNSSKTYPLTVESLLDPSRSMDEQWYEDADKLAQYYADVTLKLVNKAMKKQ